MTQDDTVSRGTCSECGCLLQYAVFPDRGCAAAHMPFPSPAFNLDDPLAQVRDFVSREEATPQEVALLAMIDAGLALHRRIDTDLFGAVCGECSGDNDIWPCATARALGVTA